MSDHIHSPWATGTSTRIRSQCLKTWGMYYENGLPFATMVTVKPMSVDRFYRLI